MKSFSLKLAVASFLFFSITSCEKARVCQCTSSFSNGDVDVVTTYESLDKTSDPDCTGYEGATTDAAGVTTTTVCIAVDE